MNILVFRFGLQSSQGFAFLLFLCATLFPYSVRSFLPLSFRSSAFRFPLSCSLPIFFSAFPLFRFPSASLLTFVFFSASVLSFLRFCWCRFPPSSAPISLRFFRSLFLSFFFRLPLWLSSPFLPSFSASVLRFAFALLPDFITVSFDLPLWFLSAFRLSYFPPLRFRLSSFPLLWVSTPLSLRFFRFLFSQLSLLWWRWRESNPWPPACRAGALPAELHPHSWDTVPENRTTNRCFTKLCLVGFVFFVSYEWSYFNLSCSP